MSWMVNTMCGKLLFEAEGNVLDVARKLKDFLDNWEEVSLASGVVVEGDRAGGERLVPLIPFVLTIRAPNVLNNITFIGYKDILEHRDSIKIVLTNHKRVISIVIFEIDGVRIYTCRITATGYEAVVSEQVIVSDKILCRVSTLM